MAQKQGSNVYDAQFIRPVFLSVVTTNLSSTRDKH